MGLGGGISKLIVKDWKVDYFGDGSWMKEGSNIMMEGNVL